jgi:RNA polymerase sigma-70 factor (ECF subfamily)
MNEATTSQLNDLIRRMNAGDPTVRDQLMKRAYTRLQYLARKMLRDFSREERWAEVDDDVLQDSIVRLLRALNDVPIGSATEYFRLAALQIRRELLDMTKRFYSPGGIGTEHALEIPTVSSEGTLQPHEIITRTFDPGRIASWSEFHEKVEGLPDAQRQVFDLIWYQGFSRGEAALLLNVSESTVKRRWVEARAQLGECLG